MQAIREIRKVDSASITVRIPEEFREKEVEIIVLPYPGTVSEVGPVNKLKQFDRMIENVKKRNITIDKDINIDELMNEMNNGLC